MREPSRRRRVGDVADGQGVTHVEIGRLST